MSETRHARTRAHAPQAFLKAARTSRHTDEHLHDLRQGSHKAKRLMLLARHNTHAACCMLEPLECRMGAGAAATDLIGIELRTERQTQLYVSFAQAAGLAKPGTAPWHKLHSSWLRSRPQLQRVRTLGGILNDAFLNDWVAKGRSRGAQRGKWPPGRKCGTAIMT